MKILNKDLTNKTPISFGGERRKIVLNIKEAFKEMKECVIFFWKGLFNKEFWIKEILEDFGFSHARLLFKPILILITFLIWIICLLLAIMVVVLTPLCVLTFMTEDVKFNIKFDIKKLFYKNHEEE